MDPSITQLTSIFCKYCLYVLIAQFYVKEDHMLDKYILLNNGIL